MFVILFALSLLHSLGTIVFAQPVGQQLTILCNPCYVNNCQCFVSCNDGKMYVYTQENCANVASDTIYVANSSMYFFSIQPGQFYARVDCTSTGQLSSCQSIYVSSYPGQTTTTTEAQQTLPTTVTTSTNTQTSQPTGTLTTTSEKTTGTTSTTNTGTGTSFSFNSIFAATIAIAVVVLFGIAFIYWRSKKTSENQYESLKRKWNR